MSASDLIASFGEEVTVTRYGTGSYVNHVYVAGALTTITPIMSIQPMNGKELMQLSEGQRTRRWVKGWCSVELFTATESTSKKADIVTWRGVNYEVQRVQEYRSTGNTIAPHWRVEMVEVNADE